MKKQPPECRHISALCHQTNCRRRKAGRAQTAGLGQYCKTSSAAVDGKGVLTGG